MTVLKHKSAQKSLFVYKKDNYVYKKSDLFICRIILNPKIRIPTKWILQEKRYRLSYC